MFFAVSSTVTDLGNGFNYTSGFSSSTVFGNGNRFADLVVRTSISDGDAEDVAVGKGCCGASSVTRQCDGDV